MEVAAGATGNGTAEEVELFFDFLSPYAYFAVLELPEICRRHGVRLTHRPILFAALLDHWEHRGPAEIPPKALHMFRECARYAARKGHRFHAPRFHPFNPLTALRTSLAADDVRGRVIEALFRGGWGDGIDLGSRDDLTRVLDEAGLDGAALVSRADDPAVKDALRAQTARAIELGVFGIPTMLAAGELFWGKDRLDDLDRYLGGDDPIAGLDLGSIAPKGSSAVRPRSKS